MLHLRSTLAEAWEVGNVQRYLGHLSEVAPFTRPSHGPFRCQYGPVRTRPVESRFWGNVNVVPQIRAKVALDQARQRHQETLCELALSRLNSVG